MNKEELIYLSKMPEEKNNKKLEYLKRGEVRTMEKDLARLREQEAEKERERIAKLRTEEEAEEEKKKQELARREAKEREGAEEEAKKRVKELERLREEEREKAASAEATAAEEEKREKKLLEEKLRETQAREEEERRKFLERVESRAEGLAPSEAPPTPPTPPLPLPPPPKKLIFPKVPVPKIIGVFPQKPSILSKVWARVIVSLLIFAIFAAVATFWYWYLVVRPAEKPAPPEEQEITPIPEKPEITRPFINEKILNRGYHIPLEPRLIDTIIIHSIYNVLSENPYSIEGVIEEYKMYDVAAHYLITREGEIYQTAPKKAVAYHAGISQMPDGRTNVNNFSIGIELIYAKTESPTEVQYLALAQLVKYLRQEYDVLGGNILGHKDITPARKDDPWNFNWEYFQSLIK